MTITPDPGYDIHVADLLDRNPRWWDVVKLDRLLLPCDKELVLSIPVSWLGGEDSLAWHFEKNGEYSVRSGYSLALSQKWILLGVTDALPLISEFQESSFTLAFLGVVLVLL
ncbi:hypothetical protein EZV62_007986 [Acer yangbiense]|uniref:Reverse transcriptase zinc-binding domain-containing protein n=1 Tax=Acer yangbiense TaxID=1000413 RepID=A0A5C7IC37_9ROSI|nr:hypothetical protein EZV62_007986 [Acer yangbiense]